MEQQKSEQKETMRLNKFLSDAGVCSRRQADRYVEEGRIEINGRKAVLGERITGEEEIRLNDRLIKINRKKILLAVNKPKGIVCTTQVKDKDNIVDYLGYPERIYPVGRLDKDSEGLILMTNDGGLMDEILRARNYHEKEYEVRVDKPITREFIKAMSSGVEILDTVTRPCKVTQINKYRFRIILTQGLNRQIRRMCEALGYRVRDLKRIRIMNIHLGSLPLGAYRELTREEWKDLQAALGRKERP